MALLTIGADVEVFAKDKHKHIALCGLVGGTKEEPKPVAELNHNFGVDQGFAVQEDNVSLEFNIPPATSAQGFADYISAIKHHVTNFCHNQHLVLSTDTAAVFDDDQLQHPTAQVFGCEPDYNAWTKTENKKPYSSNKNLRTAGGHIHIGTDVDMIHGVKLMDLFLGVPSVIIDKSEASKMRRELYGMPGAMRPKPYGFEYRVLGNFWIWDNKLVRWVFSQSKKAMTSGENLKITTNMAKEIQRIIIEGDENAARALVKDYGLALPSGFK